ncbi:MlaA family lipoprotein [Coraliomargarita parva]|uniref:MlaA family lipoprotein n=1 Tax=Coraliomargarita parva TaxID=3014050 RepID=UPI0022B32D90|nr:VacJ family lipoprotein [Coraliomargarita parva]
MTSKSKRLLPLAGLFFACFAWTGVASADDYLSEEELYGEDLNGSSSIYDPLEPVNRVLFKVNDFLYIQVLDPVANTYQAITPDPVERSASNFFENLRYPIRLSGNLLQARWKGAWIETGRFAINSTVGIAGLFTPADKVEGFGRIPPEGIAQALGAWGVPEGPYLVIPLIGPSNLRDATGLVGAMCVHPTREPFSLISDWDWEWKTAWGTSEILVDTPSLMDRYNQMKGSAIDPYGSLKNGYTQFMRAAIAE